MAKEERKQEKRDEIDSIMRRRHVIRYSLLVGSIVLLVAILVLGVVALARVLYLKNDHFVPRFWHDADNGCQRFPWFRSNAECR